MSNSNTWADQTLGALLSVAYTGLNLVDEGFSTVRWATPSGAMSALGALAFALNKCAERGGPLRAVM